MKIRLEDIIDLEYFISIDDELESKADIESLAVRDRKIFSQCNNDIHTSKDLLLSWLALRKKQYFKDTDKRTASLLPGRVFSSFYTFMVYLMIILGSISGIVTVYSFLAYYGIQPINVMVFVLFFVVLQIILALAASVVWVKKMLPFEFKQKYDYPAFISLVLFFLLNGVPKILRKIKTSVFVRSVDSIEYLIELYDTKKEEFHLLFFWPLYILTSVFAFGFSAGALAGTFFKVLVTDMAFGWQSTLVSGSRTVYDIVCVMAFPWSGLMQKGFVHPSLEQIEGSRIVLKDGIQALANQDLVSWWPFLCMSIIFYALIPRMILIFSGVWTRDYQVSHFNFEKPRFSQLLLRMQSPVLNIDGGKESAEKPQEKEGAIRLKSSGDKVLKKNMPGNKACLLISGTVYGEDTVKNIIHQVKTTMFFDVILTLPIYYEYEKDVACFADIESSGADQVILVHEVWQPPIRGVLFYIRQVKAFLPDNIFLRVMLTQDAGQDDLSVDSGDNNFKIWEKAIAGLEDPDIFVARFI